MAVGAARVAAELTGTAAARVAPTAAGGSRLFVRLRSRAWTLLLVVDFDRFAFFALAGLVSDIDGRAGSRTVGPSTGEVSIREAMARFDGAPLP